MMLLINCDRTLTRHHTGSDLLFHQIYLKSSRPMLFTAQPWGLLEW